MGLFRHTFYFPDNIVIKMGLFRHFLPFNYQTDSKIVIHLLYYSSYTDGYDYEITVAWWGNCLKKWSIKY